MTSTTTNNIAFFASFTINADEQPASPAAVALVDALPHEHRSPPCCRSDSSGVHLRRATCFSLTFNLFFRDE